MCTMTSSSTRPCNSFDSVPVVDYKTRVLYRTAFGAKPYTLFALQLEIVSSQPSAKSDYLTVKVSLSEELRAGSRTSGGTKIILS